MAKNIVICSDGTGNTSIKGRGTNVFKLFEAIDLNGHRTDPAVRPQIAFYDDGVGTSNFKLWKIVTGAFGLGLSRNVCQLYKELVRIYDGGADADQIYLFGFSRGAFTIRTLAGLIANQGILPRRPGDDPQTLNRRIKLAYKAYRRCYRPWLWRQWPWSTLFPVPAREQARDAPRIRFIGVWDTVDAVGLPFHIGDFWNRVVYQFKFASRDLSTIVDQACHALSIDDERAEFAPVLWNETNDHGRIEQVWFAGAHSNVGGGYPKQGMSLVALDWMMEKARHAGLRFLAADRDSYRAHANVDDKLYDPRAGLGIFYRWKPRDITRLCQEAGISRPAIHMSVLERIAHGTEDYVPGNIPDQAQVWPTPQADAHASAFMATRADALGAVLGASRPNMLPAVRGAIRAGLASYYLYLSSCLAAVLLVITDGNPIALVNDPFAAISKAGTLIGQVTSLDLSALSTVAQGPIEQPRAWGSLTVAFLLSLLLSLQADHRLSAKFARFWQPQQQLLREALKATRKSEV
jgi:uncharacterized protein (DUF2235 family)